MAFEPIGEAAKRVIYSCAEEIMSQRERVEALKNCETQTRAAIRHEMQMKQRAVECRNLAITGSLNALAVFIRLADQYDDAVLRRRACERLEAAQRLKVELGEKAHAPRNYGRSEMLRLGREVPQ